MRKILSLIISATLMLVAGSGCTKKEKPILVSGSATLGPLMKQLAESFSRSANRELLVAEVGSLKGLSLLISGKNDIADSSVKMPSSLAWEAQKNGVVVREILIGYDIIIPIVHPSNTIGNLYLGRMADMYTGLIKDWKEEGGKPGPILVVDRNDDSGTRLVMSERFFESQKVVEGSVKKNCDSEVIAFVTQHPGAIGYISKSSLAPGVKVIKINARDATIENVETKLYPLYRELYLYVNEKSYNGAIKSFIEFVLSKKGQDMMQQKGFIPVARLNKN